MSNISNRRSLGTIAAIGAAAVFGMFSFGNGAQAATNSSNCYVLSTYGLTCCDHMSGSRLINVNASCQDKRRFLKRKHRRPNDLPPLVSIKRPIFYYIERDEGGGNGGGGRSKDSKSPNSLR